MSIAAPVAGASKLEKSEVVTFIAGTPGSPGSAGSPGVPEHWIMVRHDAPSGNNLPSGWTYTLIESSVDQFGNYRSPRLVPGAPVYNQRVSMTVAPGAPYYTRELVPAVPAVPSRPAVAAVPSQTLISANLGWNSGAATQFELTSAGRFDFYAPENLVGAVCGLAQFATVDYERLTHAFYLDHGQIQVCENGNLLGVLTPYRNTDRLTLQVNAGGTVQYLKNGESFYQSTLHCPLFVRLVACLYSSKDAVYDLLAVAGLGTAESVMRPMTSFALDLGANFAISELPRITSSAGNLANHASAGRAMPALRGKAFGVAGLDHQANYGISELPALSGGAFNYASFVRATLPAIGGYSASEPYGFARSVLPALRVTARAGGIQPAYNAAQSVIAPVYGGSLSLLFNRATATSSFPPITGIAASKADYTTAASVFPPITGRAFNYQPGHRYLAGAITARDRQRVQQHLFAVVLSRGLVTTPLTDEQSPPLYSRVSSRGRVGSTFIAVLTLPQKMRERVLVSDGFTLLGRLRLSIDAAATADFAFSGEIRLPQWLRDRLLVGGGLTIRDKLLMSIVSTVHAIDGPTSALNLALQLLALVESSAVASDPLAIQKAMYVMMADRLRMSGMRVGSGSGNVPGAGDFEPHGLTSANGQTWVVNLEGSNKPSSRYEGYDFNSFAFVRGRYYGARPDGIYQLDGEDDDGKPITASLDFGNLNFGTLGMKRPTNAYIGATSSGNLVMKVVAEGEEYLYVARDSSDQAATQRFDFGKGLAGSYIHFELFNGSGEDFEMESIEFMAVPLSRRV